MCCFLTIKAKLAEQTLKFLNSRARLFRRLRNRKQRLKFFTLNEFGLKEESVSVIGTCDGFKQYKPCVC